MHKTPMISDARLVEFDRRTTELERQAQATREEIAEELGAAEKRVSYLKRQLERIDRIVHRVAGDTITH